LHTDNQWLIARTFRNLVGAVTAGVILLMLSGAAARPVFTTPAAQIGTVDTLAGPGFCDEASDVDHNSNRPRALAVDQNDRIFSDGALGQSGAVRSADQIDVSSIETGIPAEEEIRIR